ncbi:MAG TPA: protein kinase [Verrucomicrobiae bacterium]|nr:protein kinase [Verrucomicrobiae bacterium]
MAKSSFSPGTGFGEELSPGLRVGGATFILKRLLGRGENSEVWLAQDVKAGREVALKFLPAALLSDANVVERFKQEAQRTCLLVHPHIAATYEFVRNYSSAAIVSEYVEGWSLATFKIDKPQQRYRVEEIEWWIRQLGAALDFAHHEFGIVHRDLKPANLLVNAQDELKVTDFGIAASVRSESARRGLAGSGGLGFLSPQQVMGAEPSKLDDIYSFGATIFDLLTSTPPFYKGEVIAQICGLKAPGMKQRLQELGIADDSISPVWEDTVAACLAKNPADRPQSVKEVLQLLERSEVPKLAAPQAAAQAETVAAGTDIESPEEIVAVEADETFADAENPFDVEFEPDTPVSSSVKKPVLVIAVAAVVILILAASLAVMKWKAATSGGAGSAATAQSGRPGALDKSFDPGTGANGEIRALVIQPDGKILVGGRFTSFNDAPVKILTRLAGDGKLDATFKPDVKGSIGAVTVQVDGRILVGGERMQAGHPRRRVVRLNENGTLDKSFGFHVNYNGEIRTFLAQPDGKILVGGSFSMILDQRQGGVVRLNADGTLDRSFALNGGTAGTVWALAIQPDGRILAGGGFDQFNGAKAGRIIRLNPNGSLDSSFNVETDGKEIFAMTVQGDGKILIAGDFQKLNGLLRPRLVRLNADGSVDSGFYSGLNPNGEIRTMALQPDGKILIGGGFSSLQGENCCRVARLNPDGNLDKKFNVGLGASYLVWRVALQPDGKIMVGGEFENFDGVRCGGVARLQN